MIRNEEGDVPVRKETSMGKPTEGDIVDRLRCEPGQSTYLCRPAYNPTYLCTRCKAADEIEKLRKWKAEASSVLDSWESAWKAIGSPGELGVVKSDAVVSEFSRLTDIIKSLTSGEMQSVIAQIVQTHDTTTTSACHWLAFNVAEEIRMVALGNEPAVNPYTHDHNPLNADFHGGMCHACEWNNARTPQ